MENNCGVPISYIIMRDTPSPEDNEIRNLQINYQEILVGSIFTRYSRKVLDIIKELTLGTDVDTWIKGLKCVGKAMQ